MLNRVHNATMFDAGGIGSYIEMKNLWKKQKQYSKKLYIPKKKKGS